MNIRAYFIVPLVAASLLVSGCKSESEITATRSAGAAESETGSALPKTVVRSISTGSPGKKSAAPAPPSSGSTSTTARTAATTESNVLVHGKVTLPDGSPAAGVLVALYGYTDIDLMQGRLVADKSLASTTVDKDGHYQVSSKNVMGLHIRVSGNVPAMLVHLEHQSLYDGGKLKTKPIKIRKDITTLPGFKVAGAVVDETGKQLPGLPVYMRPKPQSGSTSIGMNTDTTSTAAGTFELANIAAGTWFIGTTHPDYAPVAEEISVPTSAPVTLQLGLRGGTVTGHVFHKDTGAAAGGLPVKLFRADVYSMLGDVEKYETKSAGDGSFQFDHVSSGPKRLLVDTGDNSKLGMVYPPPAIKVGEKETTDIVAFVYPGHTVTGRVFDKDTQDSLPGAKIAFGTAWSQLPANAPNATSDAEGNYRLEHIFNRGGNGIALNAELEGFAPFTENQFGSYISISLPQDSTEMSKDIPMIKTIKVSGRVVTKDDVPVPHAEVALYENKNHSQTDQKTTVNPDGTFELECIPFVSAIVEATASGFGRVLSDRLEIATKDVEGLKLVMDVGALVQGRVLDPGGKPLSGVQVLEHREFNIYTKYKEVAISGEDGEYQVRDASKRLLLRAKQEGYADSEVLELSVSPGETKENADLILREGFSIAGRVITSNGQPVVSSHVSITNSNIVHTSDQTDSSGNFELKDMPEGTYTVWASGGSGSKEVQGVKSGTKDLEIVVGESLIKDGVKFIGTVVDDLSGDPIRDFTIEPVHQLKINKLNDPGKFELVGVQVSYGYNVTIASEGYMKQTFDTESSSRGEDIEQTFRLGKGGAIIGRVIERGTNKPVPDVAVINWGTADYHERQRKGPQCHTTTDAEGKFTLAPAESGRNSVQIKPASPHTEVAHNIEVKSEQVSDLGDIEVGAGGTIRGIVVRGANEEPVPGHKVSLSAYSQDLRVNKSTSTNEHGQFEFTELPPMDYTVEASSAERSVKVSADNTADVKLVLGGVTVKGTVYRGGNPHRASVGAVGPGGQRISVYTQTGEYELKDVVPGSYDFNLHPQVSSDTLEEKVEIPDQAEFIKDFRFPDCSLTVLVVDGAGQPVPRASVSLAKSGDAPGANQGWQGQRQETSYSDSEGRAKFEMLKPGIYSLTGQKEEVGSGVLPSVQVADGDHGEVRLELKADGGRLESLALSYTTGQGVAEAWCYLYGENGQFAHAAKRDAAGLMVINNIPPGTYKTNVSYWSHSMSERQVEIKTGETVRIEDVLYPGGVIRWHLMKADGSAASGVTVNVAPISTDPPEQPRTGKAGPQGWLVERGLAPGTYQLTAQYEGKPAVTETFTVTAGKEALKEIKVPGW